MLISTLKQLGFSEKQAKIYLAALELGETTIKEIAKKASIKRTTIYDVLDNMIEVGLIKQTVKESRRRFIAANPDELQILLQKRKALLDQIMPTLDSMNNVSGVRPKIRFYEGKEGLKEVYSDTLNYSGEILGFASEDILRILGVDWSMQYIKQRLKKGIYYKGIAPKTKMIEEDFSIKDQEHMRSTKLVDPKKYPFSVEINIYGHQKIAIMSPKDTIGVIIESAEIYQTQKSVFELLWDNLPEIELK